MREIKPNLDNTLRKKLTPVAWKNVKIVDGFWGPRQEINRTVTLPAEYDQCKNTGRIDALKLKWKPGDPNKPHHYWDSDIAKWIEAAAYSLALKPDNEIEKKVDEVIELIEKAQYEDGYINTYFSVVEPGKRWTNVYVMHELYCAGHLIEAAVAYYEATGKRRFLNIMCRYADHIDSVFGREEGKKRGYCGHQEIELALVKLYRVTGEEKYLKLSCYFIDERGKTPHFFEAEAIARGEDPEKSPIKESLNRSYLAAGPYAYFQAHLPVREQTTAEGHAVRVMYMCSAMADLAAETGDKSLLDACETLWENVTKRRMYITGGVGPLEGSERFTFDYDCPNESAYNETCASIGLVFWAHRMLQFEGDGKYTDIMEQTLYNGVISGVSLSGDSFFYANHLASHPGLYENKISRNPRMLPERQKWFECSCCPPNLARLTASLGEYIYSKSEGEVYIHLFIQSETELELGNKRVILSQKTEYPWDEKIEITVSPEEEMELTLSVRIPGWCNGAQLRVNGEAVAIEHYVDKGYFKLKRLWSKGDKIELVLPMPVEKIEAHPSMRNNCGRIALMRGPLVYCLEETDNGKDLNEIFIPAGSTLSAHFDKDMLGGIVTICADALIRDKSRWENQLYKRAETPKEKITVKAIPYYAWSNRKVGEMIVWMQGE